MDISLLLWPVMLMPQGSATQTDWTTWPPRDYLVESLIADVQAALDSQDPETGRFGTDPWICGDQNVVFTLAAAWALEHEGNPWHHDDRVLEAIAKGGEALVEDQDEAGMWTFRKKDDSTWGQIHMPWTYSRWIRAYELVGEALPTASREKWEEGLLLGFTGIRKYMDGGVHNIPCHHAMALYIAGVCFDNEEWRDTARGMMHRVVEHQDPGGFWSEHSGPVVGYNKVYVDALGTYYHFSHDEAVLEALRRSAQFHASVLWPDGSTVSCIDERQIYHAVPDPGNVGFSYTPEGRGFLLKQISTHAQGGGRVAADYAASMLLHGGEGQGVPPAADVDRGRKVLGDGDAAIERRKPWQWCLSAYVCDPVQNRWIQDRHNLVDVFHDELGLLVGGGNTKLQSYWSTFTVGDPSLLKHEPGDESPDFVPDIDLRWTPTEASLDLDAGAPRLVLKYGDVECWVRVEAREDGGATLTYHAPADAQVEAHLPLLYRGPKLRDAGGRSVWLTDGGLARDLLAGGAGRFTYNGLEVAVPRGARLHWPARQHNPYTKDGSSAIGAAKLVVVLPFEGGVDEHTVVLSPYSPPPFDGLAFEARDLPSRSDTGTRTKRLDEFGSQFLGAEKPGDSITFTLPEVNAGTYDLYGEFVMADSYGIVEVLVDDEPAGEPFDAYCPAVDAEGERVHFGTVDVGAGAHEITVRVVGKSEEARDHFISVKRWLLAPE